MQCSMQRHKKAATNVTLEEQLHKNVSTRMRKLEGERRGKTSVPCDKKLKSDDRQSVTNRQSPTTLSSPLRGQNMPVHVIHPHPHRRHYPHHLLDHFSGVLTHQESTSATWKEIVEGGDTNLADMQALADSTDGNALHATRVRPGGGREDSPRESSAARVQTTKQQSTKKIAADKTCSRLQQWPFFGTESRVLPSGRRVSFLRQACLGFSLGPIREKDQKDNMHVVCPRAFREPSFGAPRNPLMCSGANVAELKQKFTSRENSPTKQPAQMYVGLNQFEHETVQNLSEVLHAQQEEKADMRPCTTIIDSSSTKGRHPVPRAPGIGSPLTPTVSEMAKSGETPGSPGRQRIQPRLSQRKNSSKHSSPSPTKKESPSPWRISRGEKRITPVSPTSKPSRGAKIVVPNPGASSPSKSKPISENIIAKTVRPVAAPPAPSKRNQNSKSKPVRTITEKPKDCYTPPSSDSFDDGSSSLIVVEGDDDITSTYEEISVDATELSDRNFLIDYGDPSRFYFRNEWEARMRNLGDTTNNMKERLKIFCQDQEDVYKGTLDILNEVENVKLEMGELYDYFDHFEREEDTLLQQVQRQLTQANRYCRILHYRLERAENQQVDNNRVLELEEELKLSRQVAVSLHWELQAADIRQAKLEKENINLRYRLLASETSQDALNAQVARLQNNIDQMSLHAPSQAFATDNSECATASDSTSEMKRQIKFMEEKEQMMIARLVDLQKEKDCLRDELDLYKDQYGELATVPASGANRHTDLKLRLKLAEDQAGLLARKVIEIQLENDNMVNVAAEKDLMAKEALKRNPSVSDLQFLEDERESLRLALDEMEIENQTLAAELLRYKQAVHRQLHSNSASAESPLDVGVVLRVPRSNDSIFEDDKPHSRSHKSEDRSLSHHDSISEHTRGDRKKLRPLSLTSPLNQAQKRNQMSISRTLSDIAIPLSPDTKSLSVQITPTISTNTQGPRSASVTNGSRKSFCHKCKRAKKVRMVDAAVETEVERPTKLLEISMKSTATSTGERPAYAPTRSQATSPILTSLQNLFQPVLDVATQIRERKISTRSKATSPMKAVTPTPSSFACSSSSTFRSAPRPHNALLDEMRKQLAKVRNIAESMDTVVNVKEIDAELERRGRELVDAEYKKAKGGTLQKKKIAKLAKSLQKYIRDMEESVADESEKSEALAADVAVWNLHGNVEVLPNVDIAGEDTSTLTLLSTSTEEVFSVQTVRSLATRIGRRSFKDLSLRGMEGIVMLVIIYVLLTSLPATAMIQIFFLIFVFFIL